MTSDWGVRLVNLARGASPETSVTEVTTRNRSSGYVSEVPVVTVVTPVTSLEGPFPKTREVVGVTRDVVAPNEVSERAALIEYGAGVPRDWALGFAQLDFAAPAPGFSNLRWRQLINDGARFLDRWAREAASQGWQARDVFGVHPVSPSHRFDCMGLVPLIGGGEVISITEMSATIRSHGGSHLIYRRRNAGDDVFLWDLSSDQ